MPATPTPLTGSSTIPFRIVTRRERHHKSTTTNRKTDIQLQPLLNFDKKKSNSGSFIHQVSTCSIFSFFDTEPHWPHTLEFYLQRFLYQSYQSIRRNAL
jgi:hypothetical protein